LTQESWTHNVDTVYINGTFGNEDRAHYMERHGANGQDWNYDSCDDDVAAPRQPRE
jgi:hypothetical protein